jgi:hypothetical protein
MMFLYIQICKSIFIFRIVALCCVSLEPGKVFWDINFDKFWAYFVWKAFFYNKYWNCNYIVSISGFNIGGYLLDCSL